MGYLSSRSMSGGKRVLIIDPDRDFAVAVRSELTRRGCAVYVLSDNGTGLQRASRYKPDLILLSADLRDSSGFEACRVFRTHPELSHVPLVLISAEWTDDMFERHRQLPTHADEYIKKPIAIDELLSRLTTLLPPLSNRPVPPVRPFLKRVAPPPPKRTISSPTAIDVRALPTDGDQDVRIDETGLAMPRGALSAQRMMELAGDYRLIPASDDVVMLKRKPKPGERERKWRLSGEITSAGALCDIVAFIAQAGWSGELVTWDGRTKRSIFLEPNHVVSARSTSARERLREVLYRYGALTREQVDVAAAYADEHGLRFGEAVAALGILSQEELFPLMRTQMEEVFRAMLIAETGVFYLVDSYDESQLWYRCRCALQPMLMDTVRVMDEMKYFRQRIPSDAHVPERAVGRTAPVGALGRVYDAIDGSSSIADLCRTLGKTELDLTRALFELAQGGLVALKAPRPLGATDIVAVFNQAIVLIMREVDTLGAGDSIRADLTRFVEHHGLYTILFNGAGPAEDGSVNATQVGRNLKGLVHEDKDSDDLLAHALYEYASYAMFLARPRLLRASQSRPGRRLSVEIAEVLAPLEPGAPRSRRGA